MLKANIIFSPTALPAVLQVFQTGLALSKGDLEPTDIWKNKFHQIPLTMNCIFCPSGSYPWLTDCGTFCTTQPADPKKFLSEKLT